MHKMKIYNISSYVGKDGFATLRPSNRQIIKKVNPSLTGKIIFHKFSEMYCVVSI